MKKEKVKNSIMAFMMVLVMCVCCSFTEIRVCAEEISDYLLNEQGMLEAVNQNTAKYSFDSDKYQKVNLLFIVDCPVELSVSLKENKNTVDTTIYSDDWEKIEVKGQQWYTRALWTKVRKASYSYQISSNEEVQYLIAVDPAPTMKEESKTITAGQKEKLKVINAEGTVTWSSNKESVAKVTSNGAVRAKKPGTAIITATIGKEKITCKVIVKKNVYTRQKAKINKVKKNSVTPQIYHVSYKKGALVCKVNIINRADRNVESLEDILITIKDKKGKTIAKQKFSKKSVSISKSKSNTITFTIDKKNVKQKNADLRNAECNLTGKWK